MRNSTVAVVKRSDRGYSLKDDAQILGVFSGRARHAT